MSKEPIYRVSVHTTQSRQPSDTYWKVEILYCGCERTAARIAYHASEPLDFDRGMGSPARTTVARIIEDAGQEDFFHDPIYREDV